MSATPKWGPEGTARKGIPLLVPDGQLSAVVELIAVRNLIAHNRGVVDARFLKATGATEPTLCRA